ncbi:MAG TPA: hypothetical protein VFA44_07665 [Gaiellaceae bacterium]|nr:hypothetical protein [Gaiellaceae bacterium]
MSQTAKRPSHRAGRSDAELLAAADELRRSNADLERLRQATAAGFELLDRQTHGELRLVVEQACDELAALVDRVLEGRGRSE